MRAQPTRPVHYLVGARRRVALTRFGKASDCPGRGQEARKPGVQVKNCCRSRASSTSWPKSRDHPPLVAKERAIRRRQLKRLWARLKQLSTMEISARGTADEARSPPRESVAQAPGAWSSLKVRRRQRPRFTYWPRSQIAGGRHVRREERPVIFFAHTTSVEEDPAQAVEPVSALGLRSEEAFQEPQRRPRESGRIFHQLEARIEAARFYISPFPGLLPATSLFARRCMRWRPG